MTNFLTTKFLVSVSILQSTPPVNSYPDNSDLGLIRMYLRPSPFGEDQSNIIRLNRISHYSYYFIRCPVIRIRRRRIQLYFLLASYYAFVILSSSSSTFEQSSIGNSNVSYSRTGHTFRRGENVT